MKIFEWHKVSGLKIFSKGIQIFSKTLFISLMEEVMSSSLQGFVFELNLNSWRSNARMKVLGKSFHSLSLNFQKVSNFTHFQSINQTINHIYLISITFQNL